MANPQQDDNYHDPELHGLARANRDEDQTVHYKGWEKIEGGKGRAPQERKVGADFTRAPFDESLVRDEYGDLIDTRNDPVNGYGEPRPEKNYPRAYSTEDLTNTDLNPKMVYPKHTTVTFNVWALVLGLVAFGLFLTAMFWNFLPAVRRSPEHPNSSLHAPSATRTAVQQFAMMVYRSHERR